MTNLLDLGGQTGLIEASVDVTLNWKADLGNRHSGPEAPIQGFETSWLAATQSPGDGSGGSQLSRPMVHLQASISASPEAAKPGGPTAFPVTDGVTGRTYETGRSNAGPNSAPSEPLYADQLQFDLLGNGGGRAFIETVWDEFTGDGINVGVYDSGVQSIHHDLDDNYNSSLHVVVGGNDLFGGFGLDTLIGGRGADNLFGGDAFDVADYSASLKKVFVSLFTNLGTGGDPKGDVLDGIEGLIGSAIGDSLVGDNGDNTLSGGGGADILSGRGGIDSLDGKSHHRRARRRPADRQYRQ